MQLRAYNLLSTRSRRAIVKTKGKFGRAYNYSPRGDLLLRLSQKLGLSLNDTYQLLMAEREYLLKK